jgi:hypothetical protein
MAVARKSGKLWYGGELYHRLGLMRQSIQATTCSATIGPVAGLVFAFFLSSFAANQLEKGAFFATGLFILIQKR